MLAGVALIPGPPLLVPELIGSAATETTELRHAVLAAGRAVADADRWIALGVAGSGEWPGRFGPDTVGTYCGFGAEVTVRLGVGHLGHAAEPDAALPLAALTVGWVRDRVAPDRSVEVLVVPDAPNATEQRAAAAAVIDALGTDQRVALVLVGDGARTLTERAPGGLHPDAEGMQRRLDHLLATADLAGLADLDEGECARVGVGSAAVWRIGATAVRAVGDRWVGRELYRGHPFGVGYWVGTWLPEES